MLPADFPIHCPVTRPAVEQVVAELNPHDTVIDGAAVHAGQRRADGSQGRIARDQSLLRGRPRLATIGAEAAVERLTANGDQGEQVPTWVCVYGGRPVRDLGLIAVASDHGKSALGLAAVG